MDNEHATEDQQAPHEQPTEQRPLPLDHAGEGETADDPVDDASADSFPASDPPSFTGSTTD
jgi:hypothetical protein